MADIKSRIILEAVDKTKGAIDSAKGNLSSLEGASQTLNGTIARLAPLIGAATFTAFVKGGIDTLDMLGDLQDRTGTAATTLAGFQLVASQSDTSLEALGNGINKLSIFMAKNGDAAKKLGLDAKDPADAFVQLSDILVGIENPQQRAALASQILGKSYQELLPALLQGSDALKDQIEKGKEYSGVTAEGVIQAQRFNDELDELKVRSQAAGVSLAVDLLPTINDVITSFINAKIAGVGFFGTLEAFNTNESQIGPKITETAQRLRDLQKAYDGLDPDKSVANKINDAVFGDRSTLEKQIAVAKQELASLQGLEDIRRDKLRIQENKNKPRSTDSTVVGEIIDPVTKSKGKSFTPDVANEAAKNYATLYGEFTKIIDGTNEMSKAEQALADIQAGKFADLLPWQQEQLSGLADQVKAMESIKIFAEGDARATETEIELENEKLAVLQQYEAQQQSVSDMYDNTLENINQETEQLQFQLSIQGLSQQAQNEKIAARNAEIQLQRTLNELAEAGLGLSEEEIEALRAKYTEIENLNGKLKQSNSTAKDLGLTFTSAAEDAIVSYEDLGDVLEGLEKDLIRIATRKLVTEPFSNAIGPLFEGFDIGSFFTPNAKGGVYSGAGISSHSGSIVSSPTVFPFAKGVGLMGEAGPEAILPLRRGSDGKLGVQADGGSGSGKVEYNVSISVDATGGNVQGNNQKATDLGRQLEGVVRGVLLKEKRPGGVLA
jgi:hypothetical protein